MPNLGIYSFLGTNLTSGFAGPAGGGTPITPAQKRGLSGGSRSVQPSLSNPIFFGNIYAPNPKTGILTGYQFGQPVGYNSISPLSPEASGIAPTAKQQIPSLPAFGADPWAGIGSSIISGIQGLISGFQNYIAGNQNQQSVTPNAPSGGTNIGTPTGSNSPTNPPATTPDTGSSPQIPTVPTTQGQASKFFTSLSANLGPILIALAIFVIVVMVLKKK